MLRWITVGAVLLLTSCGGVDYEPPVPAIAVYQDRFEFHGEIYATVSALAIGITAASAEAVSVEVRDCVGRERLVDLISMLRRAGYENVTFQLPEGC